MCNTSSPFTSNLHKGNRFGAFKFEFKGISFHWQYVLIAHRPDVHRSSRQRELAPAQHDTRKETVPPPKLRCKSSKFGSYQFGYGVRERTYRTAQQGCFLLPFAVHWVNGARAGK